MKKFCQKPLDVDVEKPKEKNDEEKPNKQKKEKEEKDSKKNEKEKIENNIEKPIEKMTLVELKEVAKKMKISGAYKMKKEELLKNIKENC